MPSTEKRLTKLEDAVLKHLTESGEIRNSIKNLHEAVELISSRMWGALFFSLGTMITAVGFLLKVTLWK